MNLTSRQWEILRAITQIESRDAARGDLDRGLVEQGLLTEQPTAVELDALAAIIANAAHMAALEEQMKS